MSGSLLPADISARIAARMFVVAEQTQGLKDPDRCWTMPSACRHWRAESLC
jgi:hypothetical protein